MEFTQENYNTIIKNNDLFKIKENYVIDFDNIPKIADYLYYGIRKTKYITDAGSSYNLKHYFEEEIEYCSNGEFILSAILAGFKYKTYNNSNPSFNMRESDVKFLYERNQRRSKIIEKSLFDYSKSSHIGTK